MYLCITLTYCDLAMDGHELIVLFVGKSIPVFQEKVTKNAKYGERKTCFGDQSDSILKAI